ncbi:MAG: disulfide bond formation protein B [Candidatus Peribacteraceae bacterium]|nr:disulfide bond formation protein B [Candidatus Peribacteraceae bacterium]MDD5742985.1 disulfide bond formation protein B [Candidatus Peribacteraceae bacterium]
MFSLPPVVSFLAVLSVVVEVFILFLLVASVAEWRDWKRSCRFTRIVDRYSLPLLFTITLTATGSSLYFSEVLGWTPCKLCWFQRIFMYPQLPLALLALWRRDRGIAPSILVLSLIGMCFSIWHYGEQVYYNLYPELITVCDSTGVSCVNAQMLAFGYMTIPMMALTAFALNALISGRMVRRISV